MSNMKRLVIRTLLPSLLIALFSACVVMIGNYYSKPHVPPSVEAISRIDFPAGAPGDTVYNDSTFMLNTYAIFVNLQIKSSDLKGPDSFTISVSYLSASCDNKTFVSLGNNYKTLWRFLQPGTYKVAIYWKLDIPVGCAPGEYNFNYSVNLIDSREGNIFDQFSLCLYIIGDELPTFLSLLIAFFWVCLSLMKKLPEIIEKREKPSSIS